VTDNRVEVVRWVAQTPVDDDDEMAPAARHARPAPGVWHRTVGIGRDAMTTSSEAIAAEADAVAEHMMAALQRRQEDGALYREEHGLPDPLWQVSQVQVSFGVQLTGEASVAVFSASTESSAQIVLTFSREAPAT
jgi:hypothetical protein